MKKSTKTTKASTERRTSVPGRAALAGDALADLEQQQRDVEELIARFDGAESSKDEPDADRG